MNNLSVKTSLLYEGKAKKIYNTMNKDTLVVEYKDSATAFNGAKSEEILCKGELNNKITAIFFAYLTQENIPNHFIKRISKTEQLVQKVKIIPIEVVVRNIAAGSLCHRLGLQEGFKLPQSIVEFYYKNDALGDPLITLEHVRLLNLIEENRVTEIYNLSLDINRSIKGLVAKKDLVLVDCKFEFGFNSNGDLLLADEISPDTCRFWDKYTGESLDKDRFRKDLADVKKGYQEISRRLGGSQSV